MLEEKRRTAIGAAHDEIADVVGPEALRAVDQIGELDGTLVRHPKANRGMPARIEACLHFRGGQFQACARVPRRTPGRELRAARDLQLFRRAEARIGQLALGQLCERLVVEFLAFALAIRRMRAADVGALVPLQTEPAQFVELPVEQSLLAAFGIGVLDAQHEATAGSARSQEAE